MFRDQLGHKDPAAAVAADFQAIDPTYRITQGHRRPRVVNLTQLRLPEAPQVAAVLVFASSPAAVGSRPPPPSPPDRGCGGGRRACRARCGSAGRPPARPPPPPTA